VTIYFRTTKENCVLFVLVVERNLVMMKNMLLTCSNALNPLMPGKNGCVGICNIVKTFAHSNVATEHVTKIKNVVTKLVSVDAATTT
jgi:hypothetical protein